MTLRAAVDDFKRHGGGETVFPGERRTTAGLFSGLEGRLVHVGRDGGLRDFSYPLTGHYGIDRSRFGVRIDGHVHWFDDREPVSQRYVDDTALVETTYQNEAFSLTRLDLTLEESHVTHVTVEDGDVDALVAFVAFAPGGGDDRVGQLVYEDDDVIQVYHREEHDLFAGAPGFDVIAGQLPERIPDICTPEPAVYPNSDHTGKYEDGRLGGYIVGVVPLEDDRASVVSTLTTTPDPETVVTAVSTLATVLSDPESIHDAAPSLEYSLESLRREHALEEDALCADLRVMHLLSSEQGGRIAGPDFDPHYTYSGGYGYTWFRDDAEIAWFLLESDRILGLGLDTMHDRSATFYGDAQLPDGTWPHRVWPDDGSMAPGWANDRFSGDGIDYQADQSASVLSFLAAYADTSEARRAAVEPLIESALDGLDATLADDGLPIPCQNAWENMTGRFTHTAGTFLHAYAAVAGGPFGADLRTRSRDHAEMVYDGLDQLWVADRNLYALREEHGTLDARLDSSTFALVDAHRAYAEIATIDDDRLERLRRHVDTTLEGLYRDTGAVRGLYRFEGDGWRTRHQHAEKVWTVSTAWGANATAVFADLTGDDEYVEWSHTLLTELLPGGSLCLDSGYLPEQVFDDGTPDSATPLGWPHALRLATVAELFAADELTLEADRTPTPPA